MVYCSELGNLHTMGSKGQSNKTVFLSCILVIHINSEINLQKFFTMDM